MIFKQYLPTGLFGRTLIIIILPVILLQLTATIVFFDRHWTKMTERLAAAVAGEIAIIINAVEKAESEGGAAEDSERIRALSSRYLELLVTFKKDEKLETVYEYAMTPSITNTLARELQSTVRRPFMIRTYPDEKQFDVYVETEAGVLQISMPERRLYSSSGYIFILWLVGLSCFFFAISVLLMRNQIRPIYRLAIAADRLGKGRDVSFFKARGAREVRQASEAFLKMRDRIHRQIEQRTAMLAGVSHDLRTPLTRLKLQLAMLDPSEDVKEMRGDIDEMEKMIEAYLDFAKGAEEEPTETIDFSSFMMNLIEKYKRDGRTIDHQIENDLSIMIRRNQMERAITNLLNNALKFGAYISIVAEKDAQEGKYIFVTIADDGPGIPEDEREAVFKPFYRIESSRNIKSGGVGLGMSIAQDIVHAHGGAIVLDYNDADKKSGLKVKVRLPI